MLRRPLSLLLVLVAAPVLCAPLTVTGRVLGPDGAPLAGCPVSLTGYTDADGADPDYRCVSTTSGADGGFSLAVDGLSADEPPVVLARHPDFPVAWANAYTGLPVMLRLSGRPLACSGVVTALDGSPVPGARVHLVTLNRPLQFHWSHYKEALHGGDHEAFSAVSDAAGHFSLGNLPAGARLCLSVEAPGFARTLVSQLASGRDDVHLWLPPAARLSGLVVFAGQPVAGAWVLCHGTPHSVTSGADGSFAFEGLAPGQVKLSAELGEPALVGEYPEPLRLQRGEQKGGVVLELQRAATVTGRCLEARSGRPLAGVFLFAGSDSPASTYYSYTHSAADGTYRLRLVPGPGRVVCNGRFEHQPLYRAAQNVRAVSLQPGETQAGADLALTVEPAVQGQVLLPDGTPAAGVEVGTIARVDFGAASDAVFCARSDAGGHFALQLLARQSGSWGVLLRDQARGLAAMPFVKKAEEPLTVQLQPAAWLLTRVTTPEGQPVAGWPVEVRLGLLTGHACRVAGGTSDAEGRVRLGPLPAGVEAKLLLPEHLTPLWANAQDFEETFLKLTPGEERQVPPLLVRPQGRTLRGWVGDTAQRPLPGALVVADRAPFAAVSDARGRFELTGLALQGKVRVVAMHPSEPLFAGINIDPDGTVEPGLVPVPLRCTRMCVKGPDGKPVRAQCGESGIYRVLTLADELTTRLSACGGGNYYFADAQGLLRMDALIAGLPYEIWVTDLHHELATRELGFYVEADRDVDLGEVILPARQ